MQLRPLSVSPLDDDAEWLVIGLFDQKGGWPGELEGSELAAILERLQAARDLPAGLGDTVPILGGTGVRAANTLTVGLGAEASFGPGEAYSAGCAIGKRLGSKRRERVSILLPEIQDFAAMAGSLGEGIVVGCQGVDLRKSESTRYRFDNCAILVPPGRSVDHQSVEASIGRGLIVGEAVNLARVLANTPPAEKAPRELARKAAQVAVEAGLEVEVWDQERLEAERFGGLLGVSAGSSEPPAFVILRHRGAGDRPPTILVGKGVTFDSGGLSLKSTDSMKDMKADMSGAAVVLGTMQAVARLNLPVNVDGYLALSENMTGGRAMKLGDVLRIRNGKTVEVLNTDAEGRLLLADALSYAVEQEPERVIDLATLTGACVVALGTRIAGLFCNDSNLASQLTAASASTGERLWQLPMDDDFDDQLKSGIADMKNVGGKWGGASTAAKFLQRFVSGKAWAHLDIAGPSWADSDSATVDQGATGCFVRTLVRFLEHQG